jgi:catechol 2,3-dioxygenase-like lactoylglutathione lyase family enzyme
MVRTWPFITVADVRKSSAWYRTLLGGRSSMEPDHPHRRLFEQIVDTDGAVLLCLINWADHELPWSPDDGPVGNGASLYFVVDDFEGAWARARSLGARVEQEPHRTPDGFRTNQFTVRDPDGYRLSIGDGTQGWLAQRR